MKRVSPRIYTTKYYLTDCSGYEEFKNSWGKSLDPRLKEITSKIKFINKGQSILDVGCGRGELSIWAEKMGGKVTGIDFSVNALRLANTARRKLDSKNIRFLKMRATDLKFADDSFDVVFLVEVLEHLERDEQVQALCEMARVLKKEGIMFLHTEPNPFFLDYFYRYWSVPISKILVFVNNLLLKGNYPYLLESKTFRSGYNQKLHVGEVNYFQLKKLIKQTSFEGKIEFSNSAFLKPALSWKDRLFNLIVFLHSVSSHYPVSIFTACGLYGIFKKR